MSEKEKQIMKNLCEVLPTVSEATKEYFLGLGEGIAIASENFKKNAEQNKDK